MWWWIKEWCTCCHRKAFWFTPWFPFRRWLLLLYREGEADPMFTTARLATYSSKLQHVRSYLICSHWWQTFYFWHLVWELAIAPVILSLFWGSYKLSSFCSWLFGELIPLHFSLSLLKGHCMRWTGSRTPAGCSWDLCCWTRKFIKVMWIP